MARPSTTSPEREQSGVHRRDELDRALRALTEAELKLALATGALDDLLDGDEVDD